MHTRIGIGQVASISQPAREMVEGLASAITKPRQATKQASIAEVRNEHGNRATSERFDYAPSNVVDQQSTGCAAIVASRHGPESFLSGRILQFGGH